MCEWAGWGLIQMEVVNKKFALVEHVLSEAERS